MPYMALSTNVHMQPFLRLAELIGGMLAQLAPISPSAGKINRITLRTRGGRDISISSTNARLLIEVRLTVDLSCVIICNLVEFDRLSVS